jgi:Domain of unknown function (DUF4198)
MISDNGLSPYHRCRSGRDLAAQTAASLTPALTRQYSSLCAATTVEVKLLGFWRRDMIKKVMNNARTALKTALALVSIAALNAAPAQAHFQELIPSADIVDETTGKTITLDMVFTHPFEGGPVMDMGSPVQVGVLAIGKKHDLRPSLMPYSISGKNAY